MTKESKSTATLDRFVLASPTFEPGGPIPRRYTCEGEDVSPPLAWSSGPPGTKSFALVMDDPDAPDPQHPKTRWVHWVLFNLPASMRGLTEAAPRLSEGAEGSNDSHRVGYSGPCPPIGRHRYFFRLYALDCAKLVLEHPTRQQLEQAMQGHVLGVAEFMATYQKGDR